jgi:hypothetical protein
MSKTIVEMATEITASAMVNHGNSGFELDSYVDFYGKIFDKIMTCQLKEAEREKNKQNVTS